MRKLRSSADRSRTAGRRAEAEDHRGARGELRRLRRPEGWLTLNRQRPADAPPIARCTVERLMSELGLAGAVRGKVKRTTISDPKTPKPLDLVDRNFRPVAADRLWVADFTYCSTWSGWCYTAFVIDAYAQRPDRPPGHTLVSRLERRLSAVGSRLSLFGLTRHALRSDT